MRGGLAVLLVLLVAVGGALLLSDRGRRGLDDLGRRLPIDRPLTEEEKVQRLVARELGRLRGRDGSRARRTGVTAVRARATRVALAGSRGRVRVDVTYGVRGVAGRFRSERRLEVVRRAGRWRIRRTTSRRQQPPWEVAAFRRVRTRHFVVLAPPQVDARGGGLLTALEEGYGRIRGLMRKGRLRRRYLVVAAGTARQARALTAEIRGVASLAALTDTEVREEGAERRVVAVGSQRLVVVWPAFREAGSEAATVVAHELVHAALAPYTSGRTPAWLTEGVALYVSGDDRVEQAADLLAGGASGSALTLSGLDDPDAIGRVGGEAQSAAYAYSSSAAFYIAGRFGRDRLLRLYDVYNDPGVSGTRAAVRRVLELPLSRLERDLRRWVLDRAGL